MQREYDHLTYLRLGQSEDVTVLQSAEGRKGLGEAQVSYPFGRDIRSVDHGPQTARLGTTDAIIRSRMLGKLLL